jgi:predicted RNase H-like HicB family nuclease
MSNANEIIGAKDDREFWTLIEELKQRRAAKGIKESEGSPLFVQKVRKRIEERNKAKQMQRQMLQHNFLALFEPVDSRGFRAVCPTVENCTVEAPTREEAKVALIKALEQRLRAKIKAGESVPAERGSAEMIEVALSEE